MFTKACFPKANSVEITQNFCRQNTYYMKHNILLWNRSSNSLNVFSVFSARVVHVSISSRDESYKNSLCTFYLVNWILARFQDNKLISSIFCFPINHNHRPSGSCLCLAMWHVTWTHAMLMDADKLENLRVHSSLAWDVDIAYITMSCRGKVRCS